MLNCFFLTERGNLPNHDRICMVSNFGFQQPWKINLDPQDVMNRNNKGLTFLCRLFIFFNFCFFVLKIISVSFFILRSCPLLFSCVGYKWVLKTKSSVAFYKQNQPKENAINKSDIEIRSSMIEAACFLVCASGPPKYILRQRSSIHLRFITSIGISRILFL